jgi:hypothetical protein
MTAISTILAISIHQEGESPVYSDGHIHVSLDDEAAGCYIVISQDDQKIRVNPEEIPMIVDAAKRLLNQPGTKEK